jgi:hypothetical protein
MSKQRKETKNIFRYKFNNIFIALIEAYANTHRYDDTVMFYDSWQEWVKDNEDVIEREQMRLKLLGYDGDFNAKMYKSARYYFKNKSLEKKPAIKRRRYINLDKKILREMEAHINTVAFVEDFKPAHAYNNFISDSNYCEKIKEEIKRLKEDGEDNNLTDVYFENKIKKTYKNRYFIAQKKVQTK